MQFLLRLPVVRALHQRQLLFPAVLVLAAGVVLILGALEQNAPPPAAAEALEPAAVDPPRPAVRTLDKTPLTYFADYWAQLAERTGPRLTAVGSARTPALVVGPRLVLTTLEPVLEVTTAGQRARLTAESVGPELPTPDLGPYRLRGWDPEAGLALFGSIGEDRTPFTLTDARAMPSGSYVGAVTLTAEGEPIVAPGYLMGATPPRARLAPAGDLFVSVELPPAFTMAAVVNLDGALLGVAYAAPSGPRVISSTAMLALIERLQAERVCRAVEVADLDDRVRERLVLEDGVLIEYVHREAFEPEPPLRGGDVLIEWAGERVQSAAQFRQFYDAQIPGDPVRYRVLRHRRRIRGRMVMPGADCAPVRPGPVRLAAFGLALEWADPPEGADGPAGWRVAAVAPGGPSDAAGVEERDRVAAVEGVVVVGADDRRRIEAAAGRGEPLLLSLRRGGRTKLVVVPPAPPPEPPAGAEEER